MEVEDLFVGGPRLAPDPKHSAHEDRLIAVGKNKLGAASIRGFHHTNKRWSPLDPPSDCPLYACQGDSSL